MSLVPRWASLPMVLCLASAAASAHEIDWTVERSPALVVTVEYAGEGPFAFEGVEVREEGSTRPVAVGRTDARGKFAFVPPHPGRYEVRVTSGDGHGTVFTVDSGTVAAEPARVQSGGDRWARVLGGGGALLGLFGVWALWRGRRP